MKHLILYSIAVLAASAAQARIDCEQVYELAVPYLSRDLLDEVIATLLDDMYRIAEDNQCLLETSFHEPATDTYWD